MKMNKETNGKIRNTVENAAGEKIEKEKRWMAGMVSSIVLMNLLYIACGIGWWEQSACRELLDYGRLLLFYSGMGVFCAGDICALAERKFRKAFLIAGFTVSLCPVGVMSSWRDMEYLAEFLFFMCPALAGFGIMAVCRKWSKCVPQPAGGKRAEGMPEIAGEKCVKGTPEIAGEKCAKEMPEIVGEKCAKGMHQIVSRKYAAACGGGIGALLAVIGLVLLPVPGTSKVIIGCIWLSSLTVTAVLFMTGKTDMVFFLLLCVMFLCMYDSGRLFSERFWLGLAAIGEKLWLIFCCMIVRTLLCFQKKRTVRREGWEDGPEQEKSRFGWLADMVYFAAVLAGILLLEDILVPWQSLKWDTVEVFYFWAAANVVYLLWRKYEAVALHIAASDVIAFDDKHGNAQLKNGKPGNAKLQNLCAAAMNLLILAVTILKNKRLLAILGQVVPHLLPDTDRMAGLDVTTGGAAFHTDWVGYRLACLFANLERNMEQPVLMANGRVGSLQELVGELSFFRQPLAAANQMYGIFAVLIFVILLTAFLVCLRNFSAGASMAGFSGRALCICLAVKAVLAFLSELFMVWSSDVIFPMLGCGIGDLAALVCILCLFKRGNASQA